MCGIVIVMRSSGAPPTNIVHLADQLAHRGPDGEGYVLLPRGGVGPLKVLTRSAANASVTQDNWEVGLGHRRLAILDVSDAGAQPMIDSSHGRCIVHNGEIYNYVELRQELGGIGYTFETTTDTEVILAAYDAWGPGCLQRFNGMWAFAILDARARSLFVARDRLGIKPLYYVVGTHGLALASEIKAFTALPTWAPKLNVQLAYDFLAFGALDHNHETLFEGVKKLPAGHYVLLDLDQPAAVVPKPVQWWTLPDASDRSSLAYDDAVSRFEELFVDAVRVHLRSDVRVGSCLSGGLDSSAVVGAIRRLLEAGEGRGDQITISAVYRPGEIGDETAFVDRVVQWNGLRSVRCTPTPEGLRENLRHLVWTQDEPFPSTSIFAQWSVFARARQEGVKVMMDGQGADELLAGYPQFAAARVIDLLSSYRWIEAWREAARYEGLTLDSRTKTVGMGLDLLLPRVTRRLLRGAARYPASADWLNADGIDRLGAIRRYPHHRLHYGGISGQLCRAQALTSSLPALLHYEDRNSMAHSIEARVPFLDYRLVEFLAELPGEFKIARGETKRIMRAALRSLLPPEIRARKDKMGFGTPEAAWLKGPLSCLLRSEVSAAADAAPELFSRRLVLQFADSILEGRSRYHSSLWRIISFGQWQRVFGVSL